MSRPTLSLCLALACALALAACGGASTPQLIGSYPPGGQPPIAPIGGQPPDGYSPPPIAEHPPQLTLTYNAVLEIEVRDTYSALYQIGSIAARHNGYLLASRSWTDGGDLYGEAAIAVPAYNFDSAKRDVRRLGTVLSEELTGELDYVNPGWGGESFSTITVSLKPESANWGKKIWGGVVWVFRAALFIIPPILMLIGFVTVLRAVIGRVRSWRKAE